MDVDRGEGPSKRPMTPVQKQLRKPRKAHKPAIILPAPTPRKRKVNGRYIEIDDIEDNKKDNDGDNDNTSNHDKSDGDTSSNNGDDRMDVVKVKQEKKESTMPRGRPMKRPQRTTVSQPRTFRCGTIRHVPPCARCEAAVEETICFEQDGQQGGACFACSKSRKKCVPHGEPVPVQQRRKTYVPAKSRSRKPSYRHTKSPPQSSPPRISAKDKGKQRGEYVRSV